MTSKKPEFFAGAVFEKAPLNEISKIDTLRKNYGDLKILRIIIQYDQKYCPEGELNLCSPMQKKLVFMAMDISQGTTPEIAAGKVVTKLIQEFGGPDGFIKYFDKITTPTPRPTISCVR